MCSTSLSLSSAWWMVTQGPTSPMSRWLTVCVQFRSLYIIYLSTQESPCVLHPVSFLVKSVMDCHTRTHKPSKLLTFCLRSVYLSTQESPYVLHPVAFTTWQSGWSWPVAQGPPGSKVCLVVATCGPFQADLLWLLWSCASVALLVQAMESFPSFVNWPRSYLLCPPPPPPPPPPPEKRKRRKKE